LTQDRMEDVIPHAGTTPGLFQLYTPTDKELAASFMGRAEKCGYKAVVITLDHRMATARSEHRQLPPTTRLLPAKLLYRRRFPCAAVQVAEG
jgi:isopentenyl diphosphate isomerase/L-lactate dehydrogenase-like FMN-dependent dehydrogenase